MKYLIINADDVGLSESINEAVRQCYAEGVITGASMMSCGGSFAQGAAMLRELGKKEVGIHLALTGDTAPCREDRSSVASLLGGDGVFLPGYKDLAARLFLNRVDPEHLYLELSAQIERVRREGFTVTHLDSHEHVHMFPQVFKFAVNLAIKYDIPYIRVPCERAGVLKKSFTVKDLARYAGLKLFADRGRRGLERIKIAHNDHFLGHFHSGRIDDGIMCFFMKGLADGLTELAVHPGVLSGALLEISPWHRNAEDEMRTLLFGKWREEADAGRVRLVSHREALDIIR